MIKVHLICNAHLDPVWQWRWEEGAAEALATFRTAARLLREHPALVFNHNEAVLYQWVERYDPELFREIQALVAVGRWCIAGGWFLQPDVNLPATESLLRQILIGRRYFREKFGAEPRVAYNFDSFGHSAGLPQILRLAGYRMYIHMRPQANEMTLPADLYRWRGVDGSEVLGLRISVGLYHTERDNIVPRLEQGIRLALELERDVPVFWGLGDHGGGPTREDLKRIDEFAAAEKRVAVVHSTTEKLLEALEPQAQSAPVVKGGIERVFTGCYTSLSRLKRKARQSLGELVQAEAMRAASWWFFGQEYPAAKLDEAWQAHLFNDFHDILTGSCVEPAEQDALDLYGQCIGAARRERLEAAAAFNRCVDAEAHVPVTVLRAQPAAGRLPVEAECMLDYRPRMDRPWRLRVFDLQGKEIPSQEEQPESLLPYGGWRRKVCFMAESAGLGALHYRIETDEGEPGQMPAEPELGHCIDRKTGLVNSIDAGQGRELLKGLLFEPLVVEDLGDSWGADVWSYKKILGRFKPEKRPRVVHDGPVRRVTESLLSFGRSRIVIRTLAYAGWPVLECRLHIHWAEERKRLKLSVPTALDAVEALCEVPGGAVPKPSDGEEHVHGSWMLLRGKIKNQAAALGIANNGQHGFDFHRGEVRLSVLRSAAYCHDKGFDLAEFPHRKYMDQGVHDVRLLVTAGDPDKVLAALPGFADWLNAPPSVYTHLPFSGTGSKLDRARPSPSTTLLSVDAANIRLLACKPSRDGQALIVRLQEAIGAATKAEMRLFGPDTRLSMDFRPFEIKTLRFERSGVYREAGLE